MDKFRAGTGLVALAHGIYYQSTSNGDYTDIFGSEAEAQEHRLEIATENWESFYEEHAPEGYPAVPTAAILHEMADDWDSWTGFSEILQNIWEPIDIPAASMMHVIYQAPHLESPEIFTVTELDDANQVALGIIQRERARIGFPPNMHPVHCWNLLAEVTDGEENLQIVPAAPLEAALPHLVEKKHD